MEAKKGRFQDMKKKNFLRMETDEKHVKNTLFLHGL